ncbi:hypothetical protein A3306_06635 [Rickettsia bellii]|uniref:Uncharacterized protein n=3 Tax=Rickettsia bellii TaxID=33990 RepID=Q1RI23_RICBR|nr:hypothetical protein [Rickettsia bellii]ABE04991.1 unknown [Rickettsia bellii RML369-C]ABV79074.1 hypothetical protein A1I_03585 [Rickettsia bellii OSU 85-389]ARD86798.1 hypothetical protein A3306_06635 [Rickettsia bellii]KJV89501.1 hypothetical protein RBEAN4_0479 [Rickettsia bellii str. RML An4]KJV91910.1 hypothetical protein RBEMOGI_0526 [Rickettsia bellii str. RML Mogi]
MSKDSDGKGNILNKEQKEKIILERLEYVEKDIKNLENFAAGQFANKVKANKKPIDVKDEEFQKELNATIETEKNQQSKIGGVNAVISLKATLTDLREYLVEKGVLPAVSDGKDFEEFPAIKERINNYGKEFREKFSTNEKVNAAVKNRVEYEIINESLDFKELKNDQYIPLDKEANKMLINQISNEVKIPEELYEKIMKGNEQLRSKLTYQIIRPEVEKAFGNPKFNFTQDGYDYEITTLDNSKLTPENITNFKNSLNDKLEKANDKLMATEKLMEKVKTQNPDLTNTQVEQFEKALSKLDTKDLTQHKDTLVNTINEVSKTKLGFAEKIYTMVTGKDQEVYLNNKIDGILDKRLSSIISSQTPSVQSPSSQSANIKQVLNSPTSNFAKTKEMQKSVNRESSSQSADIKQVLSNPTRSFVKTKEMQKAINRGSMINTSSSISVPTTPYKSISNKSKQDERSR